MCVLLKHIDVITPRLDNKRTFKQDCQIPRALVSSFFPPRFFVFHKGWNPGSKHYYVIIDWDQRRVLSVSTGDEEKDEAFVFEALDAVIDDLPRDTTQILVSNGFELLRCSSDTRCDWTEIPFYPSLDQFPPGVPTIRRNELTEVQRLGPQVDHVMYQSPSSPNNTKHAVFKYYFQYEKSIPYVWHDANCTLRLPPHPNLVVFDRLVVDSADDSGPDAVIGFTTRFVAGATLGDDNSRVFKLKYLTQLLQVGIPSCSRLKSKQTANLSPSRRLHQPQIRYGAQRHLPVEHPR